MASKKGKNAGPGNPALKDPVVSKLFKTMKASVELTRDLQDKLSVEHYEWLRASSLGLMVAYSDLTGLPSPMDYIEMDAAYAEKPEPVKDRCPICKDEPGKCIVCGKEK